MFLITVVGTVLVVYILAKLLIKSNQTVCDALHKIPGPKGVPLLGNIEMGLTSNENILNILTKYIHRYGRRYKFNFGPVRIVVLANAKDAEKVMSSSAHIEKSQDYRFYSMWLGSGLLTSGGQLWHSRRKLLTPAFHFKILEDFLPVINHHSQALIQRLQASHSDSTTFDIFPVITKSTLDIICETAMGVRLDSAKQSDIDIDYCSDVGRINELLMRRAFSPWLQPEFLWKISPTGREAASVILKTHGFAMNVIARRKAAPHTTDTDWTPQKEGKGELLKVGKDRKRRAFLDLLLETQKETPGLLSDEDIREEVDTFMFEGHDTTSSCINWTIYLLGTYPEIQEKVYEELDEIFGNERDRSVTMEDLHEMKYLEMCIKESLRIYSTVPFVGRELTQECRLDSETTLPPKTTVWLHLYFIHKDPSVYPDPFLFNPERFATENSLTRTPYDFLPFSAGPRNCIGQKFAMMEVKTVLCNLFRTFRVTSMESREDLKVQCEAILKPKNGIMVQLYRRP